MATYTSAHVGVDIDKAGQLPAKTTGTVGQFLKKTGNGSTSWADVVSVTAQYNGTQKTDMTNLFLFFTKKIFATNAWTADTTYESYPYKADISCTGVTANYYPEVVFDLADATSGYFAPVCQSVSGAVRIYASDIPPATITIPTIKCTKAQ